MSRDREIITGARPSSRLEGLDALRGIAALMVAVMHMHHVNHDGQGLERAYLAVDLFFMLSGYVMARTYEARLASGLGRLAFAALRLKRLWPTMAVGAVIGMVSFWSRSEPAASLRVLAMALLFLPSTDARHPAFPSNPPAWSILFEVFANFVHALLLCRLGTRALAAATLACAGLLAALAPDMNVGAEVENLWLGLPRVLFSYGAGILIWRCLGERRVLPGWLGIVLLPLALLVISNAPLLGKWPDFVFAFVLCPVIVIAGLSPLPLGRRIFRELGALSFPLYAVHFPVTMLLLFSGYGTLVALPASLGVAWATAFVLDGR